MNSRIHVLFLIQWVTQTELFPGFKAHTCLRSFLISLYRYSTKYDAFWIILKKDKP